MLGKGKAITYVENISMRVYGQIVISLSVKQNFPIYLLYFVMNEMKLLSFDCNFFHLLRHVQNAYFSEDQMKAIPKIVLFREVSTVTAFKLMFLPFCFSSERFDSRFIKMCTYILSLITIKKCFCA